MSSAVTDLLDVAIEAALAAGADLRGRFGGELQVETKGSQLDLVTEADRAAEAIVVDRLTAAFPGDSILAEESGARPGGGRTWIIDPLDGTTNFTHGFPHFAVSIGAWSEGQGEVGVVYDPMRDELFAAARGQGARLVCGGQRTPLQVTSVQALDRALVATGFAYRTVGDTLNIAEFSRVIPRVRGVRRAGAAALDLAYVAAGRFDGFWEYRLAPWDTAAGAVLVREAGGVISSVDGSAWTPFAPSVAAGGAEILPQLLDLVLDRAPEPQ
jgi:myo-inositol-1(or 4)-monophosphatase